LHQKAHGQERTVRGCPLQPLLIFRGFVGAASGIDAQTKTEYQNSPARIKVSISRPFVAAVSPPHARQYRLTALSEGRGCPAFSGRVRGRFHPPAQPETHTSLAWAFSPLPALFAQAPRSLSFLKPQVVLSLAKEGSLHLLYSTDAGIPREVSAFILHASELICIVFLPRRWYTSGEIESSMKGNEGSCNAELF